MALLLNQMTVELGGQKILDQVTTSLNKSSSLAVIGPTASGKTTFLKALAGHIFFRGSFELIPAKHHIEYIDQQHRFKTKNNTREFYYQQRFNSADAETTLTVAEFLNTSHFDEKLLETFGAKTLLNKPLIQLSNGESKRVQITKALLTQPDLIIMDNPFIGLDKEGRNNLNLFLHAIIEMGIDVILSCEPDDIPTNIEQTIVLNEGRLVYSGDTEIAKSAYHRLPSSALIPKSFMKAYLSPTCSNTSLINMHNVTIAYGKTIVLNKINWRVEKGEKWCIKGKNGSGKSTLLSLITADNPQAYANDIMLFGKKRGTGESIWDIKKNIGYVSPEIHLHFDQGFTVYETIASGLYDTIGLFRKPSAEDHEKITNWIEVMGLSKWIHKPLFQLSLGVQRMVILTRAFVKSPCLLILDEPCQGLDRQNTKKIRDMLDGISQIIELSLVYVSHYTDDIPSCITHFLTIENGCIVSES
jgi:molybdate transport system ATP-binding protein